MVESANVERLQQEMEGSPADTFDETRISELKNYLLSVCNSLQWLSAAGSPITRWLHQVDTANNPLLMTRDITGRQTVAISPREQSLLRHNEISAANIIRANALSPDSRSAEWVHSPEDMSSLPLALQCTETEFNAYKDAYRELLSIHNEWTVAMQNEQKRRALNKQQKLQDERISDSHLSFLLFDHHDKSRLEGDYHASSRFHMFTSLGAWFRVWRRTYRIEVRMREMSGEKTQRLIVKVFGAFASHRLQCQQYRHMQLALNNLITFKVFEAWRHYLGWCRVFNRLRVQSVEHEKLFFLLKLKHYTMNNFHNRRFVHNTQYRRKQTTVRCFRNNVLLNKFALQNKIKSQFCSMTTFRDKCLATRCLARWRQRRRLVCALHCFSDVVYISALRSAFATLRQAVRDADLLSRLTYSSLVAGAAGQIVSSHVKTLQKPLSSVLHKMKLSDGGVVGNGLNSALSQGHTHSHGPRLAPVDEDSNSRHNSSNPGSPMKISQSEDQRFDSTPPANSRIDDGDNVQSEGHNTSQLVVSSNHRAVEDRDSPRYRSFLSRMMASLARVALASGRRLMGRLHNYEVDNEGDNDRVVLAQFTAWGCQPLTSQASDTAMQVRVLSGAERRRAQAISRALKLLEAFLELGIPELLGKQNGLPMKAMEICSELGLDKHRGWKYLHSLALSGLLDEFNGENGDETAEFCLSKDSQSFFGTNGIAEESYYFRDMVLYWRYLNDLPTSLVNVLKGADLPQMPVWPPATFEAAQHLEKWMTVTSEGATDTLLASKAMQGAATLLDVGGGDGTIAIAVVGASMESSECNTISATVFNLPASAALARENIAAWGMHASVSVVEGNFLTDELPRGPFNEGFDRVLFSRVLTDWTPAVCRSLFEKARRALAPGGRLVINEAFAEGNPDYFIAWEYRYIFYDTFGRVLFKPLEIYRQLLEETGFSIVSVSPMLDNAFYSVVVAEAV
eukprot:gene21749-27804_t